MKSFDLKFFQSFNLVIIKNTKILKSQVHHAAVKQIRQSHVLLEYNPQPRRSVLMTKVLIQHFSKFGRQGMQIF